MQQFMIFWIFDLGILILDSQNGLEWSLEQKTKSDFFKIVEQIHMKYIISSKTVILNWFGFWNV